jgi:hypothetical protein
MLGLRIERNPVTGTTIRFRPGTDLFLTNGKGLGISLILQSPIEFYLTLPWGRSRIR